MKSTFLRGMTAVTLAPLLSLLPAGTALANCSATADPGGCPITAVGLSFDRCFGSNPLSPSPTQIGNQLCGGVKDLNTLAKNLGNDANKAIQDAERDAKAALKVIGKDAINPDAIADYNKAAAFVKDIKTDFDRFLADPQCGSKASLDSLNQFFQSQMQNLVALGGIAGKLGDAALATAPAAVEGGKILTELAGLAGDVAAAGPNAKKQADALTKAIQDLQKEAAQIAALNLTSVVGDGAALVSTVGPFLGECGGCASAMATAIGALAGGSTAAGAGAAACPETAVEFGGSCWVTVGGVPVALSSGLIAALGSAPCTAATGNVAKMADYISKIQKFVDSTVKLVQSVRNSMTALVAASDALAKLGHELGSKSAPRLQRIETSLNAAIDTLNKASQIVEDDVAPRAARLGGDLLTQIGDNTNKLVVCYGKMQDVSEEIGGEAGQAMVDYIAAGALLVDGGQILTNIATQGQTGITAAKNKADSEWKAVNKDERDVYKDVWGTNPGAPLDFGKAAQNLIGFGTNASARNKLLSDIGDAASRLLALPGKALDAGKNAFLNLNNLKPNARSKFDQAAVKAHSSLVKFQAQKSGVKGRRLIVPKITTTTLPMVKLGVQNKNVTKIKLGPLPTK
ncbi:MAG: hypothetical protein IPL89_14460 [Acidobacteria bacterium]|nr:hypothetical protein [Acidobacteriota bacterium]